MTNKNRKFNNKYFMQLIGDYISSSKYGSDTATILKNGLDIFGKIDFIESSSIFLLDDLSFTYKHMATNPAKNRKESQLEFEHLLDNESIDQIIKTSSPEFFPKSFDPDSCKNLLIFPMTVSWGNLGLLIIHLSKDNKLYTDPLMLDLFTIYCNLFASSIERVGLFESLKMANAELEKKVVKGTSKLIQSRMELEAILDSVQTGILVVDDSDLSIYKANPVAMELLDISNYDNILGRYAGDFLDSQIFALESRSNFETMLKRSDGKDINVYCNIASLYSQDDSYKIISFLDISERKNAEKALIKINSDLEGIVKERTTILTETIRKLEVEVGERELAEDELKLSLRNAEKVGKMKSEFVKNVSHEFRTPLTIIRSSAQLLEVYDSKLDAKAKKNYLDRIINTVDLLTDLIQNVIHIGREDDTRDPSLIETFDIAIFTQSIFEDLQNSLHQKRILNIVCDPKELTVKIHKKNLWLIIYNLLSNAIKFSSEGSVIEVYYTKTANQLHAEIIDQGIGIAESDLGRAFGMFTRGKNVGAVSGTGLGLAVVKQIIDTLRGQILIESQLDEGSKVKLSIKLEE